MDQYIIGTNFIGSVLHAEHRHKLRLKGPRGYAGDGGGSVSWALPKQALLYAIYVFITSLQLDDKHILYWLLLPLAALTKMAYYIHCYSEPQNCQSQSTCLDLIVYIIQLRCWCTR